MGRPEGDLVAEPLPVDHVRPGPTLEKLESFKADEAHRTLGYFLGQLRQGVEIDAAFTADTRPSKSGSPHDLSKTAR
jgi:hypothetical protein